MKLYGNIKGDRGEAGKGSQQFITAWVQTEEGRIEVSLNARGDFEVELVRVYNRTRDGAGIVLAKGNVNSGDFTCQLRE
jgi:hypothetical protein